MNRKKIKFNLTKRQILLSSICLCLLFGILLGAVGANNMDEMQSTQIGNYLNGFFDTIKQNGTEPQTFTEVAIKYGKYAVIIWLCGFLAPGAVFIYIILLFRGISYGFTTALLVKEYGSAGFHFAIVSYLPQNVILIPAYLAISYISLEYILRKFTKLPPKARLRREKQKTNLEYMIFLIGEVTLIACASAIEVYMIPLLLHM